MSCNEKKKKVTRTITDKVECNLIRPATDDDDDDDGAGLLKTAETVWWHCSETYSP